MKAKFEGTFERCILSECLLMQKEQKFMGHQLLYRY